jgi:eukaryotic-like serine/threonine-protein kinase
VPVGCVISQNPAAGTEVVAGTAVALVIFVGPPHTSLPNVVNLTQEAATSALTSAV